MCDIGLSSNRKGHPGAWPDGLSDELPVFSRFRSPSFVDELTKEGALGSARKSNPRLGAERSSRTASVLQSTEKVGDPGGHKLLNRVLCPEPVTNGIADMTPRRPGGGWTSLRAGDDVLRPSVIGINHRRTL
jgi:hypothetical protein